MTTILSAKDYEKKLKATIQRTGRLGFTDDTIEELGIKETVRVKFAQDDEDNRKLYLIMTDDKDEDAFKVIKAGSYYYLNTKLLFNSLGLDFKNNTIMFDLARNAQLDEELKGKVYNMNIRIHKRKKEDNEM